jgi:hypothetical protein
MERQLIRRAAQPDHLERSDQHVEAGPIRAMQAVHDGGSEQESSGKRGAEGSPHGRGIESERLQE